MEVDNKKRINIFGLIHNTHVPTENKKSEGKHKNLLIDDGVASSVISTSHKYSIPIFRYKKESVRLGSLFHLCGFFFLEEILGHILFIDLSSSHSYSMLPSGSKLMGCIGKKGAKNI